MDRRNSEKRKPLARRLAQSLGSGGARAVLPLLGRLTPEPAAPLLPVLGDAATLPATIGIWQLDATATPAWYQRHGVDERNQWSALAGFGAAKAPGSRRIVLLGESVGRGFFYDPIFSPAIYLRELLASDGAAPVEVLDFCKTDLVMDELEQMLVAAAALQPDVIVVIAGNNWGVAIADLDDAVVAETLAIDGVTTLVELCEALQQRAVARYAALLQQVQARGIATLQVVPDFNRLGWTTPTALRIAPWLLDGNAQWFALRQQLEAERDVAKRAELANAMLQLDHGLSPVAHHVLAEVALTNDTAAATFHLDQARRGSVIHPMVWTPGCSAVTRAALLQELAAHGVATIDVRSLFAGCASDAVYLDYCHLTSRAIRTLMTEVARCVVVGSATPSDVARADRYLPSLGAEGYASMLAAIHHAHWGQPTARVLALLRAALRVAPALQAVIADFVEFRAGPYPDETCAAYHRFRAASPQVAHQFLMLPGAKLVREYSLVGAMIQAIGEHDAAQAAALQGLFEAKMSVPSATLQLHHPIHAVPSYAALEGNAADSMAPAFLRCYNDVQEFEFCARSGQFTVLEVVARHHGAQAQVGSASVLLDDVLLGTLALTARWQKHVVALGDTLATGGVHRLRLQWPILLDDGPAQLQAAATQLDCGIRTTLYPVVAEVAKVELR
jgi:hypothetical protein